MMDMSNVSVSLEIQLQRMQRELDSVQLCLNRLVQMSIGIKKRCIINHANTISKSLKGIPTALVRDKSETTSKISPGCKEQSSEESKVAKETPKPKKINLYQQPKATPSTPYDSYFSNDLLYEDRGNDEKEDSSPINFDDHTSHISVLTASEFSLRPGNFNENEDDDNTTIHTIAGSAHSFIPNPSIQHHSPQRMNRKNISILNDIHDVDVDLLDIQRLQISTSSSIYDHQRSLKDKMTTAPVHKSNIISSKIKRKIVKAKKNMMRFISRRKK